MKRLAKLKELNLLFKPPILSMLLEADRKTVVRWLEKDDAHIKQERHKLLVDEIYEIAKPIIARKRANVKRNYGG